MKLFLCEKPAQARDIASVLGANTRGDGCLKGNNVVVTWCIGHLLELANPEEYDEQWKAWDMRWLPMLPTNWIVAPKKSVASQLRAVMSCIREAKEIVIATDPDREGELIAREILERCKWRGPTKRLWLSAQDPESVRKAMQSLRDGASTEPLYRAALARSRADWLVGMNMTRALTIAARGSDTYSKRLLSIGRVQTPTLRLVVERDLEIENFKPIEYWMIVARFSCEGGEQFDAKWKPKEGVTNAAGLCINEADARAVANAVVGRTGCVESANTERKREKPPLPHNLSSLTQESSKRFGLSAKLVLDTAQSLYETHKLISYPRSDCNYLPLSQHNDADVIIQNCQRVLQSFKTLSAVLDISRQSSAWNDVKVGASAHHAIVPTAFNGTSIDALSSNERNIFTLIAQRYIAQFLPDHEYDQTAILVSISDERFTAGGRIEKVSGWKSIYQNDKSEKQDDVDERDETESTQNQRLPSLRSGQAVTWQSARVDARKTKPPKHFTDGTLIAAMENIDRYVDDPRIKAIYREKEKAGIGTDATRPDIIETIVQRQYVERSKKYLISTPTARVLIQILPPALTDLATSAIWEFSLEEIAAGRGNVDTFLKKQSELLTALVQWVRERAPEIAAKLPALPPTPKSTGTYKKTSGGHRAAPRARSDDKVVSSQANSNSGAGAKCPTCTKGHLVQRTLQKGANAGKDFLGCTGYPKCNHFQWAKK